MGVKGIYALNEFLMVKHANELFEAIYLALPVPVMLMEANAPYFTIITANDAFCKATGASREVLKGRSIFDAFPDNPADAHATGVANLKACMINAVETGKVQEIKNQKYDIIQPDGRFELRYWHTTCTPILNQVSDQVDYVINTAIDVTEENILKARTEEAEQAIHESLQQLESAQEEKTAAVASNALLHAIIDTAQAGISLLSPICPSDGSIQDFRIDMANKMLAAYVGQTPDTITGTQLSKWFPSYKNNGLFEKFIHTAATGRTNRFEFHYAEDGIDVWLDVMSTKVGEEVLVTFTDYTAMKNLQRRLEEHLTELRDTNTNLEQFAYIASHDLQEPLRKVKSFGDMLQSRYSEMLGPGGVDLIGRMQSAAARMSTLIDDLLTYSRASVKPSELEVIDTNKVLDGVLLDLERSIQQQKAIIRRAPLQKVVGQPTQIGQIFLNLIGNALKFHKPDTPPEIVITSDTVKGKEANIAVPAEQAEQQFQLIRIKDNGIGFDNAYRDRIFQIFQRLNNRSDYPGSGVGLSIVKKVVENHGGYIQADSEPGHGATFSILLPVVSSEV